MAYSKLLKNFPNPGILVWIGLRSARNGPVVSVEKVEALATDDQRAHFFNARTEAAVR